MKTPKGITVLAFDRYRLGKIWETLKDHCWYMKGGALSDPVFFTELFTADDSVILESSYGYFILCDIVPGECATLHLPFTDKKLSSHQEDVRAVVEWAMIEFELHRIEMYVYGFQRAIKRFLSKRLHFVKEGVLREKHFFRERWRDIEVYSMLREEVFYAND